MSGSIGAFNVLAESADGPFFVNGPRIVRLSEQDPPAVQTPNMPPPTLAITFSRASGGADVWFDVVTSQLATFTTRAAIPTNPETRSHLHRLNRDFSPPAGAPSDVITTSQMMTFDTGSTDRGFLNWSAPIEPVPTGGLYVNLQGSGFTPTGAPARTQILRLRVDGQRDGAWGLNGHLEVPGPDLVVQMAADAQGGLWCMADSNRVMRYSPAGALLFSTALPVHAPTVGFETRYSRLALLPDGSVVCLGLYQGVTYKGGRHLVATRMLTDGSLDAKYGGVVKEILSLWRTIPEQWSLGEPR